MKALSAEASEYVCVWSRILGDWLRWPEQRIQRFIARWEEDLTAPDQMFFHDSPIEYVSDVLQPRSLRNRYVGPDDDPVEVTHAIEHSVNQDYHYNSAQYDWAAARRRVEVVLARYGASLPSPDQPAWYEEEDPIIQLRIAVAAHDFLAPGGPEPLDLPRSAKPAELVWTLHRQGKLGFQGYMIEQTLAFTRAIQLTSPDDSANAAVFLAVVTQPGLGKRKVLVFHYAHGWRYRIYDLD